MAESKTLEIAVALIEEFEGIETEAYLDPVGVPTICAGVTRYRDESPVRMGDVCSVEVCRGHLESTLARDFIPVLSFIPGWNRFGPYRQAALISFAWNLGVNFYEGTGFEEISRVLLQGSTQPEIYQEMGQALKIHTRFSGKEYLGLVNRRAKEAEIWDREDDGVIVFVAVRDTFLKKAAIPPKYLSEEGKLRCRLNEEIRITRLEEVPKSSHAWVTFAGSRSPWAIYLPDWVPESVKKANTPVEQVDWNDFYAKVGEYISVGEVLHYDTRRIPESGSEEEENILALCREFDAIREAWGSRIGISSGYRPEPINTQSGGASDSYHVKGMALDIYPREGNVDEFYRWLEKRWSGGYGDGRVFGFIHIDMRDGGMFNSRAGVKPCVKWKY